MVDVRKGIQWKNAAPILFISLTPLERECYEGEVQPYQKTDYKPIIYKSKLFEHIICKHILAHREDHKFLTDLQHGFRSERSCETQLVTTFQDLPQMHNKKGSQIDIAVLDFSKAFDTIPHDGLLSKLKYYDIDDKILLWIYNFLEKNPGNKVS